MKNLSFVLAGLFYLCCFTVQTPTDELCGSDVATTLSPEQCDSTSLDLVTLNEYR